MTTSRRAPAYWAEATEFLRARDPVMKTLISRVPGEMLVSRGEAFYTLARSIAGQQISVKAADSIWARMEAGLNQVLPETVLAAREEDLRAFGLSGQKIRYLKEAAGWFAGFTGGLPPWDDMDDAALSASLTALPGIGQWTADMFMIFHLLRADIFPIGDLGVLKAVYLHYNNGEKMPPAEVRKLAENWRPWRTVASWYLWRALDPVPVEY